MSADSLIDQLEAAIAAKAVAALQQRADAIKELAISEIQSDSTLSDELKAALVPTVGARVAGSGFSSYALVGFGVAGAGGGRSTRSGKHKSGVGISARNVHWFALGTEDRTTGRKSYRTKSGGKRTVATGKRTHFSGRIQPIRILMRVKGRI